MKIVRVLVVLLVVVGLAVGAASWWYYVGTAERRAASNEARQRLASSSAQSTDQSATETTPPATVPAPAPQVDHPSTEPSLESAAPPGSEPASADDAAMPEETAASEASETPVAEPAEIMEPAEIIEAAEAPEVVEDVPAVEREPLEGFTQAWVEAWGDELNASEEYRNAGTGWEWPVALIVEADPEIEFEDKVIFLDLNNGECREARMGTGADLEKCGFILSATPQTWKQVVQGNRNITAALLGGDVQLLEGQLPVLMRYMRSATLMVDLAGELNTVYPEGL